MQFVTDGISTFKEGEIQTRRSPRPGGSGTVKSVMLFVPTVYRRAIECALVFEQAGHRHLPPLPPLIYRWSEPPNMG
jgi:hypothetical protein